MIDTILLFIAFLLNIIFFSILSYLFYKERSNLVKLLAEKNNIDTSVLESQSNKVYDSIALDDETEAKIEEEQRKKRRFLKIEEE